MIMGKHKINLVLPKCYIKLYDGLGAMQPQEPVVAILLWVNTRYMPCFPNVISKYMMALGPYSFRNRGQMRHFH